MKRHEHSAKCVVEYKAPGGEHLLHRSAHGTPTARPRKFGKRIISFCAIHQRWEPKAMAISEAHR